MADISWATQMGREYDRRGNAEKLLKALVQTDSVLVPHSETWAQCCWCYAIEPEHQEDCPWVKAEKYLGK